MESVTLARNAMATRFEIVLHGGNAASLRAAGEEALDEIDRLENRLSLYRPGSEIARVNAAAAREPVRVSPPVFSLLQHAQKLHEESEEAFDITIAPLVRCWGFMGGTGQMPSAKAIEKARDLVGMELVELDAADYTVRFAREGVMIDLGAIGKGYAVEQAAEILKEAGVASALLHGGTSTVQAIGQPPDGEAWQVALPNRFAKPGEPEVLTTVPLKDEAMSVSAVWGRSFEAAGKTFGHVIDPRSGQPACGAVMSVVVLPSATETDALSTALLTLGSAGHDHIRNLRPGMKTLLMTQANGCCQVEARGIVVA